MEEGGEEKWGPEEFAIEEGAMTLVKVLYHYAFHNETRVPQTHTCMGIS